MDHPRPIYRRRHAPLTRFNRDVNKGPHGFGDRHEIEGLLGRDGLRSDIRGHVPACADTVDEILRTAIYWGPLTAGVAKLDVIVGTKARFALGASRLVLATEHLTQGLYRHGLSTPSAAIPILRIPVPDNRMRNP